jgi:hypothetical protein
LLFAPEVAFFFAEAEVPRQMARVSCLRSGSVFYASVRFVS